MTYKIGLIVGSLRKDSYNKKIAHTLKKLGDRFNFEFIEYGHLALYDQDSDQNPPEPYTQFRKLLKSYDGFVFVTPEYNRSVPGGLKNAIDIASRPYGQNAFDKKPAAIISASPGGIGGFGSSNHLRQTLAYLNMPTLTSPEMYLGKIGDHIDDKGEIKEDTQKLLQKFLAAFEDWMKRFSA